jgi:hypothetical protein
LPTIRMHSLHSSFFSRSLKGLGDSVERGKGGRRGTSGGALQRTQTACRQNRQRQPSGHAWNTWQHHHHHPSNKPTTHLMRTATFTLSPPPSSPCQEHGGVGRREWGGVRVGVRGRRTRKNQRCWDEPDEVHLEGWHPWRTGECAYVTRTLPWDKKSVRCTCSDSKQGGGGVCVKALPAPFLDGDQQQKCGWFTVRFGPGEHFTLKPKTRKSLRPASG